MASGRPDYFRGVDITYQTLAQVTNRPKYGGALQTKGNLAVDASVATRLAAINGKGVLYGGSVWLDYTSSQANSYIGMKLDGTILTSLSFVRMDDYNINEPRNSIITVNLYDSTNYIYCAGLSYGITFESYLDLYYFEEYGDAPTVHYNLVYALI